tara:strand:+ start:261 stop:512 length:252 start_codon:yes stop_codon:yes gene_type:complete
MKESLIIRIVLFSFGLLLIVLPFSLQAGEIDSSITEIESDEMIKAPIQMTQKEMNDLFGDDPYLGQTSYLQSPDGFSHREQSK